jgi:integrase/recombinase XerD
MPGSSGLHRLGGTLPNRLTLPAVAAAIMLTGRLHHGLAPVMAGALTSGEVWQAYEQLLRRKRDRETTVENYRKILHRLWADLEHDGLQWWQISPEWLDRRLRRPCQPGKRNSGRPLGEGSQHQYHGVAGRFYRTAASRGWIDVNPLEDAVPPRRPAKRPRALQIRVIADLLLIVDPRIRMMILLAYHQGLRVGEICRLRVEDLAFGADPPMMQVDGKGGNRVWMPMSPALTGPLREWLVQRPAQGPLIPNFRAPDRHLDPAYASHMLAVTMRPLTGDSAHALRHTCAQQLRRLTKDPFVVRDAMRWSSAEMADTYVRQDEELLADAFAQLPDPLKETT